MLLLLCILRPVDLRAFQSIPWFCLPSPSRSAGVIDAGCTSAFFMWVLGSNLGPVTCILSFCLQNHLPARSPVFSEIAQAGSKLKPYDLIFQLLLG